MNMRNRCKWSGSYIGVETRATHVVCPGCQRTLKATKAASRGADYGPRIPMHNAPEALAKAGA